MKRLFSLAVAILVGAVCLCFGLFGDLWGALLGRPEITVVSQLFSEVLKDKSDLIVFEVTLSGEDTTAKSVPLMGVVQEVRIPYDFSMHFAVDVSRATAEPLDDLTVRVTLPRPEAPKAYAKLTVTGDVDRVDWLYPVTPQRFDEILTEIGDRLYAECAANPEYIERAWTSAESTVRSLFASFAEGVQQGEAFAVLIERGA